jgi:hypothetical protein
MFRDWFVECRIRKVLRKIARQRVALILNPGSVWVIEKALIKDEKSEAAVATCLMRGWIDILDNSVKMGQLNPDGTLPDKWEEKLQDDKIYKVTDSGWRVIKRERLVLIMSLVFAALAVVIALMD